MIRAIKILLFVIAFMPITNAFSQLSDLNLLDSLTNAGITSNNKEKGEEDNNLNIRDQELDKTQDKAKNKENNYGYTGGNTFATSPRIDEFNQPLSYFGYDFFIDIPTTYSPSVNIPIPSDYIVGPGDNIKVILFGNENTQFTSEVSREGNILFPRIGPISVAGLRFSEMKEMIKQIVSSQIIGTQASVTLGELRSINVFVLGEANKPGMFTITSLSTLTNAIFSSGGIATTGSLRNIQLKREGRIVSTFDFYDLLLKGDTTNDMRLLEGDVVFIPPITKTVGIQGEVSRPGIYELKEDESLGDLIGFSGNLKPKADVYSSSIERIDSSVNGYKLIPINIDKSIPSNLSLNNGDVIKINPILESIKNAILVSGHAQKPGFFPWKKGMRVTDLIKTSEDLLSMTDLNYVLIKREGDLKNKFTFEQIDLEEIFENGSSEENILLNDRDEMIFLPKLLTPEQITTKLIQDKYIFDDENNQWVLADVWTSMTYLRKSLVADEMTIQNVAEMGANQQDEMQNSASNFSKAQMNSYYEYSVYDYCNIPEELAIEIVEDGGFETSTRIALDELGNINSPQDIQNLRNQITQERNTILETESLSRKLTSICREQLIDPINQIIDRQQLTEGRLKKSILVYGNVHFPGTYPLTDSMTINDAIKAAGGLKESTYLAEVELRRNDSSGKINKTENIPVSLFDEASLNINLQEMDTLTIKAVSQNIKTVEITGEVYFEGVYPISNNQTISDLIERAGGITEFASTKSAFFQRQDLRQNEINRLGNARDELRRKIVLTSQSGGLGQDSLDGSAISQLSSLISGDANEANALGRLVIDLPSILNNSIEDVVLEGGDSLYIPRTQQTVSVIGEVYAANTHLFKESYDIEDYIKLSGGINNFADGDNIYLIKSDGSIVSPNELRGNNFFRGNNQLETGDTIVVPLQVQPFSAIRATTEITQIIYQMALAAAAVNSF